MSVALWHHVLKQGAPPFRVSTQLQCKPFNSNTGRSEQQHHFVWEQTCTSALGKKSERCRIKYDPNLCECIYNVMILYLASSFVYSWCVTLLLYQWHAAASCNLMWNGQTIWHEMKIFHWSTNWLEKVRQSPSTLSYKVTSFLPVHLRQIDEEKDRDVFFIFISVEWFSICLSFGLSY